MADLAETDILGYGLDPSQHGRHTIPKYRWPPLQQCDLTVLDLGKCMQKPWVLAPDPTAGSGTCYDLLPSLYCG